MPFQRRGQGGHGKRSERPRPASVPPADSDAPVSGTITAIKAQERNPERINVFLDGAYAFAVTREEALSQGLRIGRELTVDEVGSLRARDVVSKGTEAALRLLAVRPRSEKELRDRLRQKDYAPETIDAVLERVRGWGYLDDADFAQRWVANRIEHRPRGRRLLEQELRQKGIDRDTISDTLEEADLDETAAAIELAEKSAARLRALEPDVARRRLTGQLARRGFPYPAIKAAIDHVLGEREDEEIVDDE
jgi:regulatory protein